MGSRLHSWINQPVQDSQLGSGSFCFQEKANNNSSHFAVHSPLITLGHFSSPPPALLARLMPQPALSKFHASTLDVANTPSTALSSQPTEFSTFHNQPELPSAVSHSSEFSGEQMIWNVVFSKLEAAVAKNQATSELLEELKHIKELGCSGLHHHLQPADDTTNYSQLEVKNNGQSEGPNSLSLSENEKNNNDQSEIRSSVQDDLKKSKPIRINSHHGLMKPAQMHGREFPIQVLKLKRAQSISQQRCIKCEVAYSDSTTSVVESSTFKTSTPPSLIPPYSCNLSALEEKVFTGSELSSGAKVFTVADEFGSLSMSSKCSFKSSSLPSVASNESSKQVKSGCSVCFGDYKNYCIQNNLPCPQQENFGHWQFHSFKNEAGSVVCPKLQHAICGLCFATGAKAHVVESCPLLVMPFCEC